MLAALRGLPGHTHTVEIIGGRRSPSRRCSSTAKRLRSTGSHVTLTGTKERRPPPGVVRGEIVSGKRSITASTALRLGKYFGASPELWLNLQVDYDLRVAKRTTWLKAEPRVRVHAD